MTAPDVASRDVEITALQRPQQERGDEGSTEGVVPVGIRLERESVATRVAETCLLYRLSYRLDSPVKACRDVRDSNPGPRELESCSPRCIRHATNDARVRFS